MQRAVTYVRRYGRDTLLVLLCVLMPLTILAARHASSQASSATRAVAHQAHSTAQVARFVADQALGQIGGVLLRLQSDALGECERVNGVRSEVNFNSQIIHDVLQRSGRETAHAEHLPPRLRRVSGTYLRFASRERFHPLTNCALAIQQGAAYKRPADRPFPRVR